MLRRQAAVAFLAMMLLPGAGGCASSPGGVTLTPTAEIPTASPLPPTVTPTVTPAASPTPDCSGAAGTLETRQLISIYLTSPLRILVYLPPCYSDLPEQRYPVLYLFHGAYYDETQWARIGAPAAADRLISSREIPPLIIIMPFDPYAYQPSQYGFGDAFVKDMMPAVDQFYRTQADREHRALGGLSRGSSWALHFGLSRPELFGRFGMHSPVIFDSEGLIVEKWLDIITPELMPQIYLDVSENDQNIQNARWFENLLTTRGIPHEWHLNSGFHDEEYWGLHVEEYLRWYTSGWESAP